MTKRTFHMAVTQTVAVTLDESKFNDAFMAEFRESFYPFDTLEEHAEHIAQLQARGVIDVEMAPGEFIEGYGPSEEMGIRANIIATDIEWVRGPNR